MSGASGHAPTDTLGPLIIGYTVNAMSYSYGALLFDSTFQQLLHSPESDMLLDTLQMALTSHCVYFYVIIHFGEADAIFSKQVVWSLEAFLIVTAFGDYLVRCFYCERLWRLTGAQITSQHQQCILSNRCKYYVSVLFRIRSHTPQFRHNIGENGVGYIPEYHRDPCLRHKHCGGSGDMFKEGR
ncbi:hypothetical protein HETIRDRAFT_426621 [Heterobasidion irregulare TC 32-1]|uniref:Uncharacterized protein n=1 Tax=Heterobasidion irregulare (strain TC 32-1) TaxID=747525 RepID=W4KE47_HETIT|nr:uncharacterized protein HETIRDRAFT_426621 [Heterobasidion irregulare TC 32-1]ETW83311.1 hypothetical protein HETIRDRAFT_426621 [Heterobasidion irregulare TC 32-1]